MAWDTEPTAESVQQFAEEREQYWSPQSALDDRFLQMVTKQGAGRPDVFRYKEDPEKPPTLMLGYANQMLKKDVSVLGVPPGLKVTPPNDKITTRHKVDTIVEPWLNGVFEQSQVEGGVWPSQIRDMRLYGRGVSCFYVLPRLYADGPYQSMVKEYKGLVERQGYAENGDMEKLQSEAKGLRKKIDEYPRAPSNFPLRWQHYDARTTYFEISGDRPWPEAVYVRKMTPSQIVDEFGIDALPESVRSRNPGILDRIKGMFGAGDNMEEIPVYDYFNYNWYGCVVGDKNDPKLVRKWEHGLEESPLIVMEGDLFPAGLPGLRWESALFDFEDPLKALDVAASDWLYHSRRFTHSQNIVKIDADKRAQAVNDPKAIGRPEAYIDLSPDKPEIVMHLNETVEPMPLQRLGEDTTGLVAWLNEYANTIPLRPVEQGRIQGAINAVGISIALQESKSRLSVATVTMGKAAKKMARLAIRSTIKLSEGYEKQDKVYVSMAKGGTVAAGPSDLRGLEDHVQAVFPDMLPIAEDRKIANAVAKIDMGIPRDMVFEQDMQYENGSVLIQRKRRLDLQDMTWELMAQQASQGMAQLVASGMQPQQAQGIMEMLQRLPPEFMEIAFEEGFLGPMDIQPPQLPQQQPMPMLGPGPQPQGMGAAGPIRQGLSNTRRTGGLQGLSQLEAQGYDPNAALTGGGY